MNARILRELTEDIKRLMEYQLERRGSPELHYQLRKMVAIGQKIKEQNDMELMETFNNCVTQIYELANTDRFNEAFQTNEPTEDYLEILYDIYESFAENVMRTSGVDIDLWAKIQSKEDEIKKLMQIQLEGRGIFYLNHQLKEMIDMGQKFKEQNSILLFRIFNVSARKICRLGNNEELCRIFGRRKTSGDKLNMLIDLHRCFVENTMNIYGINHDIWELIDSIENDKIKDDLISVNRLMLTVHAHPQNYTYWRQLWYKVQELQGQYDYETNRTINIVLLNSMHHILPITDAINDEVLKKQQELTVSLWVRLIIDEHDKLVKQTMGRYKNCFTQLQYLKEVEIQQSNVEGIRYRLEKIVDELYSLKDCLPENSNLKNSLVSCISKLKANIENYGVLENKENIKRCIKDAVTIMAFNSTDFTGGELLHQQEEYITHDFSLEPEDIYPFEACADYLDIEID